MDAVGGVDDQLHHVGRTEPSLGSIEVGIVEIFRNIVIHQGEVSGLISFVIGYGKLSLLVSKFGSGVRLEAGKFGSGVKHNYLIFASIVAFK